MKARLPALFAAVMLFAPQFAGANTFAILLASGIDGESTDKAFPGGIDLISLGLTGPLNTGPPGSFSIYKYYDKASPVLAKRCADGKHIKDAKVVLREPSPDPDRPAVICVITMSDVLVSSFSSSFQEGQGRPTETFSLNFSRIYFRYYAADGEESTASLSLDQITLDSDGDGMSDAWEEHYGLPADRDNSKEDQDRDGLTDFQEFRLGLNPVSDSSRFAAAAGNVQGDPSSIDITWDSVPGVSYVIEWSPDLGQKFEALGGSRVADSSSTTVRITKSGPTGFFRVRPADP
jgi:type VI secretion system secreted protein Hcp